MASPNFRVIIVGGGIGGLALANSLQHAGIDYLLIEKREQLDLPQGASVGILSSAARLLDQLGCYDELASLCIGMESTSTLNQAGGLIGNVSDTLKLMEIRTGYSVFFLDRQWLLRILANHLWDRNRTVLDKTVQSIQQVGDHVDVQLGDGTTVTGDIVVGADGTYSTVRQEMWRHAELAGDSSMFEQDKTSMSAEYQCLFGISENVSQMTPGQSFRTYAAGLSTLAYVNKLNRVFWFVFVKMDQVYHMPHLPRFSEEDAAKLVRRVGSLKIQTGPDVTVDTLYNSRVACNLVSIEEAEFKHWTYGRFVCLGDSCHKMTPNLGAGAASAIEDAAVLSNTIVELAKQATTPSASTVADSLKKYQATRQPRAVGAMRFSNALTRVQALRGWKEYAYTHYVAPRLDDFAAEMFSDFVIGAPLINHLPVPPRSLKGTMPFNPKHGWVFKESKSSRMKWASPLLLILLAYLVLPRITSTKLLDPFRSATGRLTLQDLDLVTTKCCLYLFWILEGSRLNNQGSLIALPWVFTLLAEGLGAAVAAPLHFFLLYAQSPIESFRAWDNRLINVTFCGWAGALMLISCVASNVVPQVITQPEELRKYPVQALLVPATLFLHRLISAPSKAGTIRHDRLWNVQGDVPWLRRYVRTCAVVPAAVHLAALLRSMYDRPTELSSLFLGAQRTLSNAGSAFLAISVATWFALIYSDLRKAGMLQGSRVLAGVISLLTLSAFGPGATLIAGWFLREEILITRRHKDAIVGDLNRSKSEAGLGDGALKN